MTSPWAAAYDGPGALAPAGRQQIDTYLTKVYTSLHGDNSGSADLKAMAKANALPPADFKIKSKAEIDAQKDEDLKKNNPQSRLLEEPEGKPDGPGRYVL